MKKKLGSWLFENFGHFLGATMQNLCQNRRISVSVRQQLFGEELNSPRLFFTSISFHGKF